MSYADWAQPDMFPTQTQGLVFGASSRRDEAAEMFMRPGNVLTFDSGQTMRYMEREHTARRELSLAAQFADARILGAEPAARDHRAPEMIRSTAAAYPTSEEMNGSYIFSGNSPALYSASRLEFEGQKDPYEA